MTADFAFDQVITDGSQHTKYRDLLLFPEDLKSFYKCCHEEKEQDWCHIFPLPYSDTQGDLNYFLSILSTHMLSVYII